MEKNRRKRWIAGALAVAMCCTTLFGSGAFTKAAGTGTVCEIQEMEKTDNTELFPEVDVIPELELILASGASFEVETDFTNLKLQEGETAELKIAAMQDGTEFDVNVPGIYKCVYQITPKTGEPYLLARNIIVTSREAETPKDQQNSSSETSEGETEPHLENTVGIMPEIEKQTGTEIDTEELPLLIPDMLETAVTEFGVFQKESSDTNDSESTSPDEVLTESEVPDEVPEASLQIFKEGEVLSGAQVTEGGVTFRYTKQPQKDAVYHVYAETDLKAADGSLLYKKGDPVKEALATGEDGSAVLLELPFGTYRVTEEKAPDNFICMGESKIVTLADDGKEEGSISFINERQKAEVSVVVEDKETKNTLAGGIYGLYAAEDLKTSDGSVVVKKDTRIESVTVNEEGKAVFQSDLPIQQSYYIKEEKAPDGYFRNTKDIYSFTFSYTNDREAKVFFTHTFSNERVDATILLVKEDAETKNVPQGDAKFQGAEYGVFAREDIVHPDQKSGVLYQAGEQVASMTIDEQGKAEANGLYLGKYYVKELTPPEGYLTDSEEHNLNCGYEGDMTKTVVRTTTSKAQVKKQPFQLIKVMDNGQTDLLKGAGFSAYLENGLDKNEDGTYDFSKAIPVILTPDGKTELFTDERGYACSIALPYGSYIVRETTVSHNLTPVEDFKIVISENQTEPLVWKVLVKSEFKAKLKIIKIDEETKKNVLLPGTEFKVYDLKNEKYVEQITSYPSTVVHTSFFTDESGCLILPDTLPCGPYRIEEVTAPKGYMQNPEYMEIKVDSNTAHETEEISNEAVITVSYANHPVKGRLVIKTVGEVADSYKQTFHYAKQPLSGAEFDLYAAEAIYTPDHQKDAQGDRCVEYEKDVLVATAVTDENGKAVVEDLPLGKYRIVEKKAPEGFVLKNSAQEVTFAYEGQNTPVVVKEALFENERQKVEIAVEKRDAKTNHVLSGAVFGLYNQEPIRSGDSVLVKEDTLLAKATSDEQGKAAFEPDLPLGSYYVRELKPPKGYASSDEILEFSAAYQGQEVPVIKLFAVKKNKQIRVEITKTDFTTEVELDGASLQVLDGNGKIVDSWVSVKGKPHVLKGLKAGKTYTLQEETAPYGYLLAEEITFTIEDTEKTQKVTMKGMVPTARLIINKKGEFLNKVTFPEHAQKVVEHFFEYIRGSLQNVTFEVYAAETVKAADEVSPDYYAADELVATIRTNSSGIASLDQLPLGRYYVKEAATEYGHVLDEKRRYIDLTYRGQDIPVVSYDENWQNSRQRVQVEILKKEKGTGHNLSGAVFGLFTKKDILSHTGAVLLKADSLIELKTTGEDGKIRFMADLPVGGSYYVRELQAPEGFANREETQEFVFADQGGNASYSFVFEGEPTVVEIHKIDQATKKALPGATLEVLDATGNAVETWVSENKPHVIRGLLAGKTYKLVERIPVNGYATAKSMEVVVENTANVQKYVMETDVTKTEFCKTDPTGSWELPDAKLMLLDEEGKIIESWTTTGKPHRIEKLPVGSYILREKQTPKGYLLSEDMKCKVKDTGDIQVVTMKGTRPVGRLVIKSTDGKSKKALAGVTFTLKEKKSGKIVETLVTDVTGTAKSKDLPTAVYEEGIYVEDLEYVLTEIKAPEGYGVNEKESSVVFSYKNAKTREIVLTKELTNIKGAESNKPHAAASKKNIWLPVVLVLFSLGGIIAIIWYQKKRHRL